MTEKHVPEALLHDWVEGLLEPEAAARVRGHVAGCPECAAEADAIRELRAALAALPPSLEPGRDLRPGVRSPGVTTAMGPLPRLAAAAVVVVAAGVLAVIGIRTAGGGADGTGAAAASDESPAAAVMVALDREYERAGEELKARVSAGRLAPETARLFGAQLETVEAALAASRAAMREDPSSPVVRELVLSAHRQRLEVLRQAAELAAETGEAS